MAAIIGHSTALPICGRSAQYFESVQKIDVAPPQSGELLERGGQLAALEARSGSSELGAVTQIGVHHSRRSPQSSRRAVSSSF
jgi:hypothetical protein